MEDTRKRTICATTLSGVRLLPGISARIERIEVAVGEAVSLCPAIAASKTLAVVTLIPGVELAPEMAATRLLTSTPAVSLSQTRLALSSQVRVARSLNFGLMPLI